MTISGNHASNQPFHLYHASRIVISADSFQNKTQRITFDAHGDPSRTVATASKMNKVFGGLIQAIRGYNPFYTSITDKSDSKLKVNINSLSKRLNIPKKEITKALKEKRLQDFLNQILGMREHLAAALNENAKQIVNTKDIPVGLALFCKSGNHDFEYSMLFKTRSDPPEYETIDFKIDEAGLIKTRDGSQFKHLQAMEAYTKAKHEIIANETPVGAVRSCESSHRDYPLRMLFKTQSKPPLFLTVDFQIDDAGLVKTSDGKQFGSKEAMVEFLKISAIPSSLNAADALRINEVTLQRIVEAAVSQMLASKKQVSGQLTVDKHTYMYAKDMSDRLVILKTSSISEENLLGSGAFGAVYAVLTSLGTGFAYKMAITHEEAKESVIHEYTILKHTINPSGEEIAGLMHTPRAVYQVTASKSGKDNFGYLTERFTCNASNLNQTGYPKVDSIDILDGFCQLSNGLEHLQKNNITVIHGDIKLDNISFEDKRWRLIDFGGARCLKELTEEKLKDLYNSGKHFIDPHTKGYTPPKLIKAIDKAAKAGNVSEYLRLQKFRDQYALGLSFIYMLLELTNIKVAHSWENWKIGFLEYEDQKKLAKNLKTLLIESGYSKALALNLTLLIIAGRSGEATDLDLKEIFSKEATSQKEKVRHMRLKYVNKNLTTLAEAEKDICDPYKAVGLWFFCKSEQQNFEYKIIVKTQNHPWKYETIDFKIESDGTLRTSDDRRFKNLHAMREFILLVDVKKDRLQMMKSEERGRQNLSQILKNLEARANQEFTVAEKIP